MQSILAILLLGAASALQAPGPIADLHRWSDENSIARAVRVGKSRFGGNLVLGEHEHCIPSRVPPEHIKRYGVVVASSSGVPYVPRTAWVVNPKWDPCYCRYSLSDCEDVPCH